MLCQTLKSSGERNSGIEIRRTSFPCLAGILAVARNGVTVVFDHKCKVAIGFLAARLHTYVHACRFAVVGKLAGIDAAHKGLIISDVTIPTHFRICSSYKKNIV